MCTLLNEGCPLESHLQNTSTFDSVASARKAPGAVRPGRCSGSDLRPSESIRVASGGVLLYLNLRISQVHDQIGHSLPRLALISGNEHGGVDHT